MSFARHAESSNPGAEVAASVELLPLSARLRAETAAVHQETEKSLVLPRDMAEYERLLERFYCLYQPLEAELARFTSWSEFGIQYSERLHSPRLGCDLVALGIDPNQLTDAPPASLPAMPHFAHALGALYVLEGSTLGSQYILRHLRGVLGPGLEGADAFFSGHGAETGSKWKSFRAALDAYGVQKHADAEMTIEGAMSTFRSVGTWLGDR